MHIVVDPSTYDCQNMGDVAMLKVAIERLRRHFPSSSIDVFTDEPNALISHCPGVKPLAHKGRELWSDENFLLGRLRRVIPSVARSHVAGLQRSLLHRWSRLEHIAVGAKMRLAGVRRNDFASYCASISHADLLVFSGSAGLADAMPVYTKTVLDAIERATLNGVPVVMMGQGVGPLQRADLVARASSVLPRVSFVALRERLAGVPLLESLGVPRERIMVTGDDAIEASHNARASVPGDGIGVNLRLASYAQVGQAVLISIRPILHSFAQQHNAPLIPVPIALHALAKDPNSIKELLRGYDDSTDGGETLDTPLKVFHNINRCRVVVTGAYHAAVFALSQGIPAVCLANTRYVLNKFCGLEDLFGEGCYIVRANEGDVAANVYEALECAWDSAEAVRPKLLLAAEKQIAMGHDAYGRIVNLVHHTSAAA